MRESCHNASVLESAERRGGPRCHLCGRPTYDPDKRERPWARGVADGRQILVCPDCQRDRPGWSDALDRCANCGSTRLSAMLGSVVCRACGDLVAGGD